MPDSELEQSDYRFFVQMLFGLSKKQLVGWGLLATGIKVAFGFWLFGRLGLQLPW